MRCGAQAVLFPYHLLQYVLMRRSGSRVPVLIRVLLCLGLLFTGTLTACTEREERSEQWATQYTDDLGRSVALRGPVKRVVTLAPNLTEIVYAAGGGDKLVGVTTADDYPPSVDTLPRFSALPVDFEKVLSLKPDVVLATDQVNSPRDAGTFESLGMPTFFFRFSSLEDVIAGIRKAGEIMGTVHEATATADSLEAELDSLRTLTEQVSNKPSVIVLIGAETLNAFGRESHVHDLIELAGGRSLTKDLGNSPVLSEEFVLKAAPDILIGTWGEAYDVDRLLALHPTWDALPAVQQGRVYNLSGDFISRPGPRLIEGVQRLVRLIHPDLFPSDHPSQGSEPPGSAVAAERL